MKKLLRAVLPLFVFLLAVCSGWAPTSGKASAEVDCDAECQDAYTVCMLDAGGDLNKQSACNDALKSCLAGCSPSHPAPTPSG